MLKIIKILRIFFCLLIICPNIFALSPPSMVQTREENTVSSSIKEDLVFLFGLPKNFKNFNILEEDKKKRFKSIVRADLIRNKDYSKLLSQARNITFENLLKKLDDSDPSLAFFGYISSDLFKGVESSLTRSIREAFIDFFATQRKKEKSETRIKKMMIAQSLLKEEESVEITGNPERGANEGYIVSISERRKKYYTKTFTSMAYAEGKINPSEIFLYKAMEYLGMGPKVHFLLAHGSSSAGYSSIYAGNYIMTEALGEGDYEFILDGDIEDEKIDDYARQEKFAIEISLASTVNDILSVADTFGENPKNYGVLSSKENPDEYSIKFIDHLPSGNGIFTNMRVDMEDGTHTLSYSPRERFESSAKMSSLMKAAVKSRENFKQVDLIKHINQRLFGTDKNALELAVNRAFDETMHLIELYNYNFIDDGKSTLKRHYDRVNNNIKTYLETSKSS